MNNSADRAKLSGNPDESSFIPLSEYAKKLELRVKQRYMEKISAIGIDPVLIESKNFEPDCLPPVECTDLLFYLVLETSFYTQQQFKAFRSLEAYNQMVSGFITSVKGHIIANKFVVLAKVRHSQRMNDSLIPIWIITEREGTVLSAHCLGCKAGLAESCSHIASVLFYLEAWTKINGKLACTQVKCSWLLPAYVDHVEYSMARDINFTSAKKMKTDLDSKISNLQPGVSNSDPLETYSPIPGYASSGKKISPPTEAEMDAFYAELSKCSESKPIALSLIPEFAQSYVLKSRSIPTINDLFDKKYLQLTYPGLLKVCSNVKVQLSKEQIEQVERDTISQARGNNFFKHRAGRIGASQSKAVCKTNPALPSQSLIQSICYPELTKLNTEAVCHGCKHEQDAINAYENVMKQKHVNFKVVKCGLMINEEYPWIHATPDFLCSCDCCGEGCGEVKCPLCVENCNFESYVLTPSSCLEKDSTGNFNLKKSHQYFYQCQQQIFTRRKQYCDFVVCAFDHDGKAKHVQQRILPDADHWKAVVPKLTNFWRKCILPEVLGRWYSRCHYDKPAVTDSVCYCRTATTEDTISCCNPKCQIGQFHPTCLGIDSIPQLWYCPNCRTNPEFKRAKKGKKITAQADALRLDSVCVCKQKPNLTDRLLECHNSSCQNGNFFHLPCINLKRMPNNSNTTWLCPACKGSNMKQGKSSSTSSADVTFVKTVKHATSHNKHKSLGSLGQAEFDLIASPTGWLDCSIVHEAQLLLQKINPNIEGFQRPTLGPVRQFDTMTSEFIQLLHVGNNHWVCLTSIGCPPGEVQLLDSLMKPVITQEIQELAQNLYGPNLNRITNMPVQQQTNGSDCGVFAVAFATCLVYGQNPCNVTFDVPKMRPHLIQCLKRGCMNLFPTT